MSSTDMNTAPLVDEEELRYARAQKREKIAKWVLPVVVISFAIFMWEQIPQEKRQERIVTRENASRRQ